jgi:cytochrome c-type biogenesis protein CcsB
VRWLMALLAVLALSAIAMYGGVLDMANKKFFLKYLLSSQSAILWMSALFYLSTLFYWGGLIAKSDFGGAVGAKLCWAAVVMGFTGMLVRWYESYLIGADIGHIPVSNLYEVFILFSMITALFYLYFEQHYATRQTGPFVLLVISAAVGFLLWYTVSREASDIQPLVPALQSWWMKIHVPANFIGYGTFSLAAMVALAYLLKSKGILADRLPALELLDDMMYKSIAVGFAFFTIATILGALWAAEAWGGYWSWDPKETWALIVWLNYAAWLHMRLMKGLRGHVAAWWALVGLLVTTFAFLGVNMFLSGLHSYGQL